MSCHTWTYKKADALTEAEKQFFVNMEMASLQNWSGFKMSKEEFVKLIARLWEKSPGAFENGTRTPEQYADDVIQEYSDKLKDYQEYGFEAFLKHHRNDYPKCFEANGATYVNFGFDTPFRVYGYPHESFTDMETLINWLQGYNGHVGHYDNETNEFVKGFTPELETKIREFFKLHGEDNLMFRFG